MTPSDPIAIVGAACRLPGAVATGEVLLAVAGEVLERSGRAPGDALAAGVFLGIGTASDEASEEGSSAVSIEAGRIARRFGFTGPAAGVDTAGDAALVAVHLACRALREGTCTFALAGASRRIDPATGDPGVGVAWFALERLATAEADGREILAVMRDRMLLRAPASGRDPSAAGALALLEGNPSAPRGATALPRVVVRRWVPTVPEGQPLVGRITVVGSPGLGRAFATRLAGPGRIRVDHRPADEPDPIRVVIQAVDAVRAAAAAGERLVWVSRGGAHVHAPPDPAGAALIAFARVAALEHPEVVIGVRDLDPADPHPGADVIGASLVSDADLVLTRIGGRWSAPRRVRSAAAESPLPSGTVWFLGDDGFVGAALALGLAARGCRVVRIARGSADPETLSGRLGEGAPDAVVHVLSERTATPILALEPAGIAAAFADGPETLRALRMALADRLPKTLIVCTIGAVAGRAAGAAASAALEGEVAGWRAHGVVATCVAWEPEGLAAADVTEALSRALSSPGATVLRGDRDRPSSEPAAPRGQPSPTAGSGPGAPVAIVALALRVPGAADLDALWTLLLAGADATSELPADRFPAERLGTAPRRGGFLDDVASFDAERFGLSPREALPVDPQHRLLLELALEALERAGLAGDDLRGSRTGVFVGVPASHWMRRFPGDALYTDVHVGLGNEAAFAAGRIARRLGLRGPAVALNTSCSSSLLAVHEAVRALRAGDCDRALAGGVHLLLDPEGSRVLDRLGVLSADGRCRAFDATASGYGRAEGGGVAVLMRLADARAGGHDVLGLVHGTSTNHDGAHDGDPASDPRAEVVSAALRDAGIGPERIGYLEGHGTGSPLGDAREVAAALQALPRTASDPLVIGSVKANLGHLEQAAGMASLAKALGVLRHDTIPPQAGFDRPNPAFPADGSVVVPTAPMPLGGRFVGVSGFGLSGSNVHLILGPGPEPALLLPLPSPGPRLLVIGGVSPAHVEAATRIAVAPLQAGVALGDVAHTVHTTRPTGPWSRQVVADDGVEAARALLVAQIHPPARSGARIGLVFSGQGAVSRAAAAGLVGIPAFDAVWDLLPPGDDGDDPREAHPALVALGLGTAEVLRSWGTEVVAVAGYSVGELAAAAFAGVCSPPEALELARARAEAVVTRGQPGGAVTVPAGEAAVSALLEAWQGRVSIAAIHAADQIVVAGEPTALAEVCRALVARGWPPVPSPVRQGFHSPVTEPALDAIEAAFARVSARPARIPVVRRDGTIGSFDPAYWRRQARDPVRFVDIVNQLARLGCDTIVECGGDGALVPLIRAIRADRTADAAIATRVRSRSSLEALLVAAGGLRARGVPIDLGRVQPAGHRIPYPPGPRIAARLWADWPTGGPDPVAALGWRIRFEPAPPFEEEPSEASRVVVVRGTRREAWSAVRSAVGSAERGLVVVAVGEAAGVVRGALRSAASEHPGLQLRWIGVERYDEALVGEEIASGRLPEILIRDGVRLVPRLVPVPLPAARAEVGGRWVVTGGLGALGLRVARWLLDLGGEHVVLVSRRPATAAERAGLPEGRMSVRVLDAGDPEALAEVLTPDVLGVVHAAGTPGDDLPGDDASGDEDAAFERCFRARLGGWPALVEAAARGVRIVAFGTTSGWLGPAGQGAAAAVNAALEDAGASAASQGLPVWVVMWGPWEGTPAPGLAPLVEARALDALPRVLAEPPGVYGVVDLDPEQLAGSWPGRPPAVLGIAPVLRPAPPGSPAETERAVRVPRPILTHIAVGLGGIALGIALATALGLLVAR